MRILKKIVAMLLCIAAICSICVLPIKAWSTKPVYEDVYLVFDGKSSTPSMYSYYDRKDPDLKLYKVIEAKENKSSEYYIAGKTCHCYYYRINHSPYRYYRSDKALTAFLTEALYQIMAKYYIRQFAKNIS